MKDYGFNTRVSDGTDQHQRAPLAFRADYFNADEMNFEVLLSMASEYAATINYYNIANKKEGDWSGLFNSSEAVIMALIATTDAHKIEAHYNNISTADLSVPAGYIISLASKYDFWLQRLMAVSSESAAQLRSTLYEMIRTNLVAGLHTAAEVVQQSETGDVSALMKGERALSSVWGISELDEQYHFSQSAPIDFNDHDAAVDQLGASLLKMTAGIRYLQTLVADMLEHSLNSQSHEPSIGLFMVFLRLYEVAQKRLNRFTERHLEFYYRDCLKTNPRERQLESIFLKFEPVATATRFLVDESIPFSAEKNRSPDERLYHLKAPLLVRRATVSAIHTLSFQRNLLISPECELGYVTRSKSYIRAQSAVDLSTTAASMPLFGGAKSGLQLTGLADARIGLCVASPILALQEGEREIELTVDFLMPDAVAIDAKFNDISRITTLDAFKKWFGEIFSYYLLSGESFLNEARYQRLVDLVAAFGGDDGTYLALLEEPWQDLFYRLFKRPFTIALSGENGWLEVKEYLVAPAIEDDSGINSGLKISLSLGHSAGPVVSYDPELHGEQRHCRSPMIDVCLDPESSFFAYSLLNTVTIKNIAIDVSVKGVKDIVISNHLGRVDPTNPFAPFGPLPTRHSYIVVGSQETASKQLTAMQLDVEWGELPICSGGFSTHYQGYDFVPLNGDFKAEISVLQNGHWMPNKSDVQYRVDMFRSGRGGVICEKNVMQVSAIDYFNPRGEMELNERYEYRSGTRNGFVRLQMSSPGNAFGHADYPHILTRVLSENSRRKKPQAVPNAPYTPVIKQLSLNYKARTLIRPVVDVSASVIPSKERLFHLHPFGIEQAYPAKEKGKIRMFPQYDDDGNLFIGLNAQTLAGVLTLFFNLDETASRACSLQRPPIHWCCLTESGWIALEANRVLSDSTEGFLMSGVVTLELPHGMVNDSSVMPAGQYWLRASVSRDVESFSGLQSIFTNVGVLEERPAESSIKKISIITADAPWRAVEPVAGLSAVKRVGRTLAGRDAEDQQRYRTRVSERLRHKGRATSAWDYEHLILEEFPDVYKVKCFPNTVCDTSVPQPGNVLIAVVPAMKRDARDSCERGMINSAELQRIQEFVQGLSSPFVNIEVRNPVYEQIQVRCTVKFSGGINTGGLYLNRLNRAVSDYICPWCEVGYKARFGWSIRADDIESYIRELDYVDFVTNFSMLHITEEMGGKYSLVDTATLDSRHEALILPRYPWSLAVPMRTHFIETTASIEPVKPALTGVNELEIGSTLIIGGN